MKNRIRELREEMKLTQTQLAQRLSLSKPTISKYEDGSVDMSTETLSICSRLFDCSVDYILHLTNNRKESLKAPDEYTLLMAQAKNANISPERLRKLIEFLADEKNG